MFDLSKLGMRSSQARLFCIVCLPVNIINLDTISDSSSKEKIQNQHNHVRSSSNIHKIINEHM